MIEKGLEKRFQMDWKKFMKRAKPLVSKTREKQLLANMKKIMDAKSAIKIKPKSTIMDSKKMINLFFIFSLTN